MSYVMPSRTRSSTISALLRSTNSRGGIPSLSASYVIGVPCSSVPLAISTREPRSRSKRASTSAGTAKPTTWPMCRGPLAYGQAGAMSTVLGTGDHKGKLAARTVTERGKDLRRRAPQDLFVQFGQLARHGDASFGQHLRDQRERFVDAIRRLERHSGSRVILQRFHEAAHLAGFARQVTEKREARSAVAGDGERRRDRAGARDGHDGMAGFPRGRDEGLARVGERRGAGIADQRDIALVERGHDPRQAPALHRRAVTEEWFADRVARQQAGGDARVFRGDGRNLAKDADRSCAQVFEIPNRRGDHI